MTNKTDLLHKEIAFRWNNSNELFSGVVKGVDVDGLWIESGPLQNRLSNDLGWRVAADAIQNPIFFVPIVSLMYLIASEQ
jgi:hypothetical protein